MKVRKLMKKRNAGRFTPAHIYAVNRLLSAVMLGYYDPIEVWRPVWRMSYAAQDDLRACGDMPYVARMVQQLEAEDAAERAASAMNAILRGHYVEN